MNFSDSDESSDAKQVPEKENVKKNLIVGKIINSKSLCNTKYS